MTEQTDVATLDQRITDPAVRSRVVDELEAQVHLVREAMERTLVKGVHYGTIPGTQKPSLWQPGAEMIAQLFQFQTELVRTDQHEDWDKGIFAYTYKCRLVNRHGELITEREATCSTGEKKYARLNPVEIRETVMQMAQKRAYVSAVRGSAAASAIFSQDDDIVPDQSQGTRPGKPNYGVCPIHNAPFFKTARMNEPAHTYKDDAGRTIWCNKSEKESLPW